jgi:hypothetical protein
MTPALSCATTTAPIIGLPGILHVNLNTGKSHSDGENNDDESHKRQISPVDFFFARRATSRLQV